MFSIGFYTSTHSKFSFGEPSALHKVKVLEWLYINLHFSSEKQFLGNDIVPGIFNIKSGLDTNFLQTRFMDRLLIILLPHQFSKYF
jgi:hypothetical protein